MIEIDGSYLEGGGQILRTACALSAIRQIPCHIFNIRKGRKEPGLKTQHLLGLRALAELCNGRLEGDYLGSEEIYFYPGSLKEVKNKLKIKIDTAGSITLILQTLILPAIHSDIPIEVYFEGGATDTFFAPTMDHFRLVFLKIVEKMGVRVNLEILQRGFYPEGGAKVKVIFYPSKLQPITLISRGKLKEVLIISGASQSLKEKKVAERQVSGIKQVFGKLKLPLKEIINYYPTRSPGSVVNIIGKFENTIIGVDNLGKLGRPAEIVGKEAALEFLKEGKSEACLDKHLADQILPFMALANGVSEVTISEVTNHCKTNIWVIEKFLGKGFQIEGNKIVWNKKAGD